MLSWAQFPIVRFDQSERQLPLKPTFGVNGVNDLVWSEAAVRAEAGMIVSNAPQFRSFDLPASYPETRRSFITFAAAREKAEIGDFPVRRLLRSGAEEAAIAPMQ